MNFSDDEMLFGRELFYDSLEPVIVNNKNLQQWQEGSTPVTSKRRRRSRATTTSNHHHESAAAVQSIQVPFTPVSSARSLPQAPDVLLILPPGTRDRKWFIDRIEHVFEQQADNLLAGTQDLAITMKIRPRQPEIQSAVVRQFKFPGKSEKDAWRYTVILRILELMHAALISDTTITKRDIFYRDPALFSKQSVVDRFVDDLAYTFGVPPVWTATAKGLIAGNFSILRLDGAVTDGRSEREGLLVTPLKEGETIRIDDVKWVLVVEKEATFRSLVSSPFWDKVSSHGILVTGKGFPDIATRLLLRSIAIPSAQNNFASPQVYALMDFDPDGMDILSTYKHGSAALAHEKADLALPSIKWLGLSSKDIGGQDDLHEVQGLLTLSARDRRKAAKMLERSGLSNDVEPEWRRELQRMLVLNIKAEIQILEAREGGLSRWLEEMALC